MFIPLSKLSQLPDPFQNGEALVVEHMIGPHQIVFDVGANVGRWTRYVADYTRTVTVHLFEPIPPIYEALLANLQSLPPGVQRFPVPYGVGESDQSRTGYYYADEPELSTFYRRYGTEITVGLRPPEPYPIQSITLDRYCAHHHVDHIDFLKIDTEGGELGVMRGAAGMLREQRIHHIQFEYGGTYPDAGVTLQEVYALLSSCGYRVYKIVPDGLLHLPEFHPSYEDFQYSNFLAMH